MRWLLILMLAAGLAGPALRAETAWSDRQAVLDAIHALDAAIVAKDATALSTLLQPDFIGAVPTGAVFAKDAYISFHTRATDGLIAIQSADGIEPTVRVYDGRFAVVNRRLAVRRAEQGGQVAKYEVQRIEVLRLQDGRLRIASGQGTRVNP